MLNTVSKIRGQVKTTGYPQTEGLLGDCMLKYGKELGEDSTFGEWRGHPLLEGYTGSLSLTTCVFFFVCFFFFFPDCQSSTYLLQDV